MKPADLQYQWVDITPFDYRAIPKPGYLLRVKNCGTACNRWWWFIYGPHGLITHGRLKTAWAGRPTNLLREEVEKEFFLVIKDKRHIVAPKRLHSDIL